MSYNGLFLHNYGGTLALNENYSEAIPILKQAEKYLNNTNLFLSLGNCHKELENYKEAENYYQLVENIIPNRMYPKYMLAKLYQKSGNMKKLSFKANEILNMKIKVNSAAIIEMQDKVKKILEQYKLSPTEREN